MSDPKITVDGPFSTSARSHGPSTPLYLGEDASERAETDTRSQDIPTFGDEETILASVEGTREVMYKGLVNGYRLMNAGYGSDPVAAFRQYIYELESLVMPLQGTGYRIRDDMRGETYSPIAISGRGVLLDTVRWTYESGDGATGEWTVEGQVTEGMQPASDRHEYITEQQSSAGVSRDEIVSGGTTVPLGEVEERSYEREIDVNTSGIIHQTDMPNVGVADSGVKGEVRFSGRLSRNDVAGLARVSQLLTKDIHGQQAVIRDELTDREFSGSVEDSSADWSGGVPDMLEYSITLKIGSDITG